MTKTIRSTRSARSTTRKVGKKAVRLPKRLANGRFARVTRTRRSS